MELTKLSPALLCCFRRLLDLHRVVNNQVHELVEALESYISTETYICERLDGTDSNSSLNSDRQLLVEPDLNSRVLL